jgi:hypothetical protein
VLHAVKISAQMGYNQVIFEMDSATLKQAICSKEYDLAALGAIF